MEGPRCEFADRLRLTRDGEPSRLQLDLLRRAFQLLVPITRHSTAVPMTATCRSTRAVSAARHAIRKER